jgi:replicative DNA helicase
MVMLRNCQIIYIDHLEKLYDHSTSFKKHERLGYIMDRLKTIAQELKIPIVVLQQINRGVEEHKQSRPTLSDIKSSGAIEEWADTCLLLHRPEYYNKNDATIRGLFEVDAAKARFGTTGVAKLKFDAEFMRFELDHGY